MRADLLPYREATTEQVMAGNLRVTDKEVEHTLGVLEFASNVLVLGKAYFRGMRELQQSAGKRRPGARPRQLVVPMAAAHGMQMWYALIANIAVRSHCCLLDLSELHGGRSYGSGAWNAHHIVTTYASESGRFFFLLCLLCFAQEDRSPPSAGGRDVVGLVFPTRPHLFSNSIKVGREIFRG